MARKQIRVSAPATRRSLEEALEAAGSIRTQEPTTAVEIVISQGRYNLDRSLRLRPEVLGAGDAPLVLRGEGAVILSGGVELPAGSPIGDGPVRDALSPEQREHIVAISFEEAGIPPIVEIEQRGLPPIELFVRGERLPISRYPATGWLEIEDVPQNGPARLHEGLEREKRHHGVPVGRHYGRFIYPTDRPSGWGFDRELLLHGFWTWDWNDSYQTVASIDHVERAVHLAPPHHNYGYTTGQRFAFLNILEEIGPGGYCFHRESGTIYLWPPEGNAPVTASVLGEPLVRVEGAEHVAFESIRFEESRGAGIEIDGGRDVSVAGCTFTRLGDFAVKAVGSEHRISSSDFHDLAGGAIDVDGGNRERLERGHIEVCNNHIYGFSRWVHTYKYAIVVDGVGNVVRHNLMHDAPQEAIRWSGNEHLFEFNEIHSIVTETGDSGAIHTGRDWTWRDTVLRYNLIHGLTGEGLHGAMGIYLDDFMSGTTIHGNIFVRAGRAAFIGGGRENTVTNNLFFDCVASVHVDARGTSWAAYYFDGTYPVLFDAMDAMKFREAPYADRYPILLGLYDDDPAFPKHNRIEANVSDAGRWIEFRDTVRLADLTHTRNWISDPVLGEQLRDGIDVDPYFLNIDSTDPYERFDPADPDHRKVFEDAGDIVAPGSDPVPGWRNRDFTVRDEVVRATGFEQIPFERIGLYFDEFRKELPEPARVV